MGKWEMKTATAINQVTTLGTMNVNFAANGFTAEEFAIKFSDQLTEQMNIVMENILGDKVSLEIFGHGIENLETVEDESIF